jgi:putative ABC transport system substrate-binding protein
LRRLALLIAVLWLLLPSACLAYDLLVVQSQRSPVYDEVLRGFRSVAAYSQRVIVLSDYSEVDLQRIVREENPLAILTLGDNALAAARKVKQVPVISLMALSYRAGMAGHPALTGVEVQIHPERYLVILGAIKAHRVGIIANTSRNAGYLRLVHKLAPRYGVDLVVRDVKSPKDVAAQLDSLVGNVDALWMLPDTSIATGEAADAFFLFSASHRVPVVTFSSTYLASGAAIAIEIDRHDIGKQGGEMVTQLLDGGDVANIPPQLPRKNRLKTNPSVLRRIGLPADLPGLKNGN